MDEWMDGWMDIHADNVLKLRINININRGSTTMGLLVTAARSSGRAASATFAALGSRPGLPSLLLQRAQRYLGGPGVDRVGGW